MPHSDETIICPNCGSTAQGNFCYQCGQETHLHKETFWGLVMHFVGHYFHYDSKFWQTMKALWFSPGMLTLAYWNRQRMRYIPPISLYIFISAVYFLVNFSLSEDEGQNNGKMLSAPQSIHYDRNFSSIPKGYDSVLTEINTRNERTRFSYDKRSKFGNYINDRYQKIKKKHGDSFFEERFAHNLPKVFFFMIPVIALLLKLLFIRRKDLFFVDHAIFAIHSQALWFSIFILRLINPFHQISGWLVRVLIITFLVYIVKAMKNVYSISRARALSYTIITGFCYSIVLGIFMLLDLLIIGLMA